MMFPPSGNQYEIVSGEHHAVITEVGATLRSYNYAGREVILSFAEDKTPISRQGQHLIPWPNRIKDGQYSFQDTKYQLPINEHARNNAIHGLTAWTPWELIELYPTMVRLRNTIFPQPGWPAILKCDLIHEFDDNGLTTTIEVKNLGETDAPFGYGAHPYFQFDCPIDEIELTATFDSQLQVDDRLLPTELVKAPAVDGVIGSTSYDTAFTLTEPDSGIWNIALRHEDQKTTIWGDENLPWVQIYTPP
ncbi:MAG: aldose epimerase, partial [Propionibacterium sp.]